MTETGLANNFIRAELLSARNNSTRPVDIIRLRHKVDYRWKCVNLTRIYVKSGFEPPSNNPTPTKWLWRLAADRLRSVSLLDLKCLNLIPLAGGLRLRASQQEIQVIDSIVAGSFFASKYRTLLPTEAGLTAELERERLAIEQAHEGGGEGRGASFIRSRDIPVPSSKVGYSSTATPRG